MLRLFWGPQLPLHGLARERRICLQTLSCVEGKGLSTPCHRDLLRPVPAAFRTCPGDGFTRVSDGGNSCAVGSLWASGLQLAPLWLAWARACLRDRVFELLLTRVSPRFSQDSLAAEIEGTMRKELQLEEPESPDIA